MANRTVSQNRKPKKKSKKGKAASAAVMAYQPLPWPKACNFRVLPFSNNKLGRRWRSASTVEVPAKQVGFWAFPKLADYSVAEEFGKLAAEAILLEASNSDKGDPYMDSLTRFLPDLVNDLLFAHGVEPDTTTRGIIIGMFGSFGSILQRTVDVSGKRDETAVKWRRRKISLDMTCLANLTKGQIDEVELAVYGPDPDEEASQ